MYRLKNPGKTGRMMAARKYHAKASRRFTRRAARWTEILGDPEKKKKFDAAKAEADREFCLNEANRHGQKAAHIKAELTDLGVFPKAGPT